MFRCFYGRGWSISVCRDTETGCFLLCFVVIRSVGVNVENPVNAVESCENVSLYSLLKESKTHCLWIHASHLPLCPSPGGV